MVWLHGSIYVFAVQVKIEEIPMKTEDTDTISIEQLQ